MIGISRTTLFTLTTTRALEESDLLQMKWVLPWPLVLSLKINKKEKQTNQQTNSTESIWLPMIHLMPDMREKQCSSQPLCRDTTPHTSHRLKLSYLNHQARQMDIYMRKNIRERSLASQRELSNSYCNRPPDMSSVDYCKTRQIFLYHM